MVVNCVKNNDGLNETREKQTKERLLEVKSLRSERRTGLVGKGEEFRVVPGSRSEW